MIKSYADYKKYLKADLRSQGKSLGLKRFVFDPLVRFTFLLRFNEYLLNTKKPAFLRFFWLVWFKRLSVKLSFSIPFNVFDAGVAFVHYGQLIINPKAQIGKNCRIHNGVNLGGYSGMANTFKNESIQPTRIGDNCYIGPGVKIIGGVSIASNTVIGANCVVSKSFAEENITIAGVPGKILSTSGSDGFLIKGAEFD
ncbi:MAG: DapH/DapD/GlmU-related protein [Marinirhabdus sp.]|nr:DapH/DapD/GlmU-related protein [Marinirhabdus sp.]